MPVVLKPHRATPSSPITRIEVEAERGESGLKLAFRAFGDVSRVRLPPMDSQIEGRIDELWRSTCFETFLQPIGSSGYTEMNFAPWLRWATYNFDDERIGMRAAEAEPWTMMWHFPPGGLELDVGVFAWPDISLAAWRLGLSAVIEDVDGGISYWALAHPSDKPDFHHPDSFTLVLPAPEPA